MNARILYVPNEHGEARQSGMRETFARLLSAGLIADVRVFSLLWRIRSGMSTRSQHEELIKAAAKFQPDILLMQHLGGTGIDERSLRDIKSHANFLIYHEADPYSRRLHPLPREARAAGRVADVVFTVGTGAFARNFRASGASDVRWEPSIFDPGRFGRTEPRHPATRDFDIVMIANRNRPRLRGLPNWRDRIKFVNYMEKRFGARFAIFGRGWTGPSSRGEIAYSRQAEAIRSGWISANWDHFAREPRYFSDRLPTSLATGSIHATTEHPEFADFFRRTDSFLLLSRSLEELGDKIENYLKQTNPSERISAERAAWNFAHANLRQDDQLIRMLNSGNARIRGEAYQAHRNVTVAPVDEL